MQTTPGLSLWRGRSMKDWFLLSCTTADCMGRKINNNRKLPGIQGSAGRDTSKNKAQKSEFDFCAFWIDWKRWKNAVKFTRISRHSGPSVEIRTRGLLNPIQARYQTSPHPVIACRLKQPTYTTTVLLTFQPLFSNFFKNVAVLFVDKVRRTW